ncbi:MAG: hypothetical protein JXR03_09275 [Cyclobacteriaceae bacterium]
MKPTLLLVVIMLSLLGISHSKGIVLGADCFDQNGFRYDSISSDSLKRKSKLKITPPDTLKISVDQNGLSSNGDFRKMGFQALMARFKKPKMSSSMDSLKQKVSLSDSRLDELKSSRRLNKYKKSLNEYNDNVIYDERRKFVSENLEREIDPRNPKDMDELEGRGFFKTRLLRKIPDGKEEMNSKMPTDKLDRKKRQALQEVSKGVEVSDRYDQARDLEGVNEPSFSNLATPAFAKDYEVDELENLARKKVSTDEFFDQDLNSMPKVNSKVLSKEFVKNSGIKENLDSLDQITQSKESGIQELRQKGKDKEQGVRTLVMDKKEEVGLPENVFVDVFLGLGASANSLKTISPNVGFKLSDRVAIGGGVILTNTTEEKFKVKTSIGLRAFARYYIIPSRFYIHSESAFFNSSFSYVRKEKNYQPPSDWNLLAGLGYQQKIVGRFGMNIQLLYTFKRAEELPVINDSPLVFRVGLKVF